MVGMDTGLVVAIITALAGLIVALSARRRSNADANKATTEAVLLLLKPLNERITALECEVAMLRRRIASFRRGVKLLCGQIIDMGHVPAWQEDDEENGEL